MGKEEDKLLAKLRESIQPVLDHMGRELVHIEFTGGHGGRILRLYVENREGAGINVDELSEVSRDVGAMLDVEDIIPGSYRLEVSSPGLDRPLGKIEDCSRFAGETASIQTRQPLDGRRRFKGVLKGAEGGNVLVELDGNTVKIPWDTVKKANLIGQLKGGEKKNA